MFSVFFILNLVLWGEGSSSAVPFGTLCGVLALWYVVLVYSAITTLRLHFVFRVWSLVSLALGTGVTVEPRRKVYTTHISSNNE